MHTLQKNHTIISHPFTLIGSSQAVAIGGGCEEPSDF